MKLTCKYLQNSNTLTLYFPNEFDSVNILDGSIISAKIHDSAITDAKIRDLAADKINTGYLSADRIEAGSIVLSKITGLGGLAVEDDLDGVPNGTTYSKVLTTSISAGKIVLSEVTGDLDDIANGTYGKVLSTAISAGKIVLTSAGVTGTLSTALTVAKCTDADADETSAHGQNLGWLIGSTGELIISSGGKLKLNCTNALEIMAAGNIKVLAGGDINMYAAAGNPSKIKFYGTTGVAAGEFSSLASNNLDLLPSTTTAKAINIGSSSLIWNFVGMYGRSTYLYSYWDSNDYSLLKGVSGGGSSYIQLFATRNGVGGTFSFSGVAASPVVNKAIDLGYSNLAFDDVYGDDFHNVADFYNFDRYDDLAVINQIKGSGIIQNHNGYEVIDDTTLPAWLKAKHKKDGEIVDTETGEVTKIWKKGDTMSDPEGKPYLSLKACISLSWGAIRQLDKKIKAMSQKNH